MMDFTGLIIQMKLWKIGFGCFTGQKLIIIII